MSALDFLDIDSDALLTGLLVACAILAPFIGMALAWVLLRMLHGSPVDRVTRRHFGV